MAQQIPSRGPEDTFLGRAYKLKSTPEARDFYNAWASTYTKDMDNSHFIAPLRCAQVLADHYKNSLGDAAILDAGCGTGACGIALANLGAKVIDGVDLSPGMLDEARGTGAYRELRVADPSKPLLEEVALADSYDALICVGTLTHGHVGPEALGEFVRLVKPGGGLIVCTVLGDLWESGGYKTEVDQLVETGLVEMLSSEVEDYTEGGNVIGPIVVLRKE